MMKNKSILVALTFFLASTIAFAQDEMFKVLASKGGNKLQTAGTADWKAVFVGKKLAKGDKITIADNGYLGLAHKSGKTIELKKAGTYEVSKLAGEVASQNASTTTKYANYLAGEMGKTGGEDMAKNKYKYMAVTGSVERGQALDVYVPKTLNVSALGNQVMVKWDKQDQTKTYIVNVTNLFGDEILKKETSDLFIMLDLDSKKDKNYIVKIKSKEVPEMEKDIRITYPSNDKVVELNKQLSELKAQLGEENALNKIILASFYEDNKLYLEALQSYEAAVKMEPEVDDYKVALGQFLERAEIAKTVEQK
jgi:flagellar biosynthesis/type III secretory pathway chaperone